MPIVDVSDLDRNALILALWQHMKPASFFSFSGVRPPSQPSHAQIEEALGSDMKLDYLAGRCIKTDFSNMKAVDTHWYDRDAGSGAFERVAASLRT